MQILGLPGSLRQGSHNARLLRAAASLLPPGAELSVRTDLLRDVPLYDEDVDAGRVHPAVRALRGAIADADAVLIATPEYNHSIPGVLKNGLDWASRPVGTSVLKDKPVAVIGASTGIFGAVWAQAETRKVLQAIGARVLDHELPVGSAHAAFAHDADALADRAHDEVLIEVLVALAAAARDVEVAARAAA